MLFFDSRKNNPPLGHRSNSSGIMTPRLFRGIGNSSNAERVGTISDCTTFLKYSKLSCRGSGTLYPELMVASLGEMKTKAGEVSPADDPPWFPASFIPWSPASTRSVDSREGFVDMA